MSMTKLGEHLPTSIYWTSADQRDIWCKNNNWTSIKLPYQSTHYNKITYWLFDSIKREFDYHINNDRTWTIWFQSSEDAVLFALIWT